MWPVMRSGGGRVRVHSWSAPVSCGPSGGETAMPRFRVVHSERSACKSRVVTAPTGSSLVVLVDEGCSAVDVGSDVDVPPLRWPATRASERL